MRRFGELSVFCLLSAVLPAVSMEVWCPNPLSAVFEGQKLSGKDDPKCEISIAGARNGAFSGQAVAFSTTPVKGEQAKIGDLKHTAGTGLIPASAVEIRYALPTGAGRAPAGATGVFDALAPAPRETGNVHPVWITVNVPADAAAGAYEGKLSLAGREIPVKLQVADWSLPKPQDFATWVDFIESPESVALRYEKKLWSDEHWTLVGKSFDQLARAGNKTLYIPLMCQTHFGNSESMVRWIKGDKEREFTHDFSIAEKYLDVCISHAGKPRVVVLYIYEPRLGGSHGLTPDETQRGVPFTLLDPKTGEIATAAGPCHNNSNPAYPDFPADTINFWKPVIDGMRERLKSRGIGDEAIMLGISPDMAPGKLTTEYLAKTFPWARFCRQAHQPVAMQGAMPVGYMTSVYGMLPADPKTTRIHGLFFRDDWKLDAQMQLVAAMTDFDIALSSVKPGTSRIQGVGRMSGDFWPCLKNNKGAWAYKLINRYPLSSWTQLSLYSQPFTFAGPDGALGTARLEMFREGLQQCEARIVIERALADKSMRAKLGDEQAAKLQSLLSERIAALPNNQPGAPATKGDAGFSSGPWQERAAKLFAAAGEISRATGSGQIERQPPAKQSVPAAGKVP